MESSIPVPAVSPPAPYLGGKRNLASRITALIATVDHETYVEPFVGMGGIFFRRRQRPRSEVINDLSGDVANLFRKIHPFSRYRQPKARLACEIGRSRRRSCMLRMCQCSATVPSDCLPEAP
jgi:hypothetical protein